MFETNKNKRSEPNAEELAQQQQKNFQLFLFLFQKIFKPYHYYCVLFFFFFYLSFVLFRFASSFLF